MIQKNARGPGLSVPRSAFTFGLEALPLRLSGCCAFRKDANFSRPCFHDGRHFCCETDRSWFGKAKILEETSSGTILAVPNSFHCGKSKERYRHHFDAWCQSLGKEKLEIVNASSPACAARVAAQDEQESRLLSS
jgi:hypothetical protein